MDRTIVTISILILLSAIIAATGVSFGDQIAAEVPGGKATGIVAGVVILLGLFVTSYKSILSIEKNILDKEGFRNLLEIHFGSVSHQLLYLVRDAISELEEKPEAFNSEVLLINVKRVIDQSKSKLLVFKTPEIPNISIFLDDHFPPEKQKEYITNALAIIQGSNGVSKKNKMAYQLIQSIQSELLKNL